jgi:hypothetical protein
MFKKLAFKVRETYQVCKTETEEKNHAGREENVGLVTQIDQSAMETADKMKCAGLAN